MTEDKFKGLKITAMPLKEDESSSKLAEYFRSELKKTGTRKEVKL